MEKAQLSSASGSDEPFQRLVPIVELLLRDGNSLTYPEQQAGFMLTQGGLVCYLNRPINFDLVESSFDLPAKVRLLRDEDSIFDEQNWIVIEGPKEK